MGSTALFLVSFPLTNYLMGLLAYVNRLRTWLCACWEWRVLWGCGRWSEGVMTADPFSWLRYLIILRRGISWWNRLRGRRMVDWLCLMDRDFFMILLFKTEDVIRIDDSINNHF